MKLPRFARAWPGGSRPRPLQVVVKSPAPDAARADAWGDTHVARALAVALGARDLEARVVFADAWDDPATAAAEVSILLRGVRRHRPLPGQISLMWMLSHPDKVTDAEIARYDHVFVASQLHARTLAERHGDRVSGLLQCADPARFGPEAAARAARKAPRVPLLFVGNSRKARRWIVSSAIAAGHPVEVWGAEWEGRLPPGHLGGLHVPNDELAGWYLNADIVLNDHWPDMAEKGFLSNRLFDVAMAGGFVITDRVAGAGEVFGPALVTVGDSGELDAALRYHAARPEERAARAAALSRVVREGHDFAARAAAIADRIAALRPPQ